MGTEAEEVREEGGGAAAEADENQASGATAPEGVAMRDNFTGYLPRYLPRAGLLAGLTLAGLVACSGDRPSAIPELGVPIHTVRRGDLKVTVEEKSELQAKVKTTLRSKMKGWVALLFLTPEGTEVAEGDLLAELDASKHEEFRAKQAIIVSRARSSLEQVRKNLEIMETRLLVAENTAVNQLRIAEMELEKFMGRQADGMPDAAGTNLEMVEKLEAMLAEEFLDNPGAEVEYAGLADQVRELLGEDNLHRAMGQTANRVLDQIDRISLARADLELKRDTLEHSESLAVQDFITKNELERDKLAYESQLSRVTLSWNNIDLMINYTLQQDWIRRKQDVLNADLNLENTRARNESERVGRTRRSPPRSWSTAWQRNASTRWNPRSRARCCTPPTRAWWSTASRAGSGGSRRWKRGT